MKKQRIWRPECYVYDVNVERVAKRRRYMDLVQNSVFEGDSITVQKDKNHK